MIRALRIALPCAALVLAMLAPSRASADWPESGLPVGDGAGAQTLVDLVADGAAGGFVVWRDAPTLQKRFVRITSLGGVAAGWASAGVVLPDYTWLGACGDGAGGLVLFMLGPIQTDPPNGVAWRHVLAWRFDGAGALAPGWPAGGRDVRTEVRAMSDDLGFETLTPMGVVPDGSGGAYLAMQYARGWGLYFGYHMTHVGGDATVVGNWDPQNGNENQSYLRMDADGSGGVVVAMIWYSDVVVRRYGPTGAVLASWGPVYAAPASALWMTRVEPGSDLVVSWRRFISELLNWMTLTVRLAPDLALAPGWASAYTAPFAAAWPDGQGGAFGERDSLGVRQLQRLSLDAGPPVATWPQTRPLTSPYDVLEWDGETGIFHLWADLNEATSNLWAVHLQSSGTISPGWDPFGRRLTWLMASANARRVARVEPGVVFVAWTDARGGNDVYLQRLDGGTTTGVNPSPRAAFALRGFASNPSRGSAVVEFTLPDAASATLELYDVSGRRLVRREVGAMGAGTHRVMLGADGTLPAGVYYARLQRGGSALVRRGALLR